MLSWLCALVLSGSICVQAAEPMSREQAAQHVQQHYGGKILDIQPLQTGQGPAYRVKLLQPSGRVKLMLIDARDGKAKAFKGNK